MIGTNFSLELINAETGEQLKEFVAPDGKVYVEAEPDLEYFIRCHEYALTRTIVKVWVDGQHLGYHHLFKTQSNDLGLVSRKNGVSTHRALKLTLKRTNRGAAASPLSSSNTMASQVGRIHAYFYEPKYIDGMFEQKDFDVTNCLNNQSSVPASAASGAKKAFVSVPGSQSTSSLVARRGRGTWKRGRFLEKVTIYYTSALGVSQLCAYVPIVSAPVAAAPAEDEVVPPAAVSSSTVTRNNDSQGNDDDNDDDVVVITEPDRKRVKTEPTPCATASSSSSSDNFIDLTQED